MATSTENPTLPLLMKIGNNSMVPSAVSGGFKPTTTPAVFGAAPAAFSTVAMKKWFKIVRTVNMARRFTIHSTRCRNPKDKCKCHLEQVTKSVIESKLIYTTQDGNIVRSVEVEERLFWDFVRSSIWLVEVKITSGFLLDTLVFHINKLEKEGKLRVYRSVEYHVGESDRQPTTERLPSPVFGDGKKEEEEEILRVTTEYYCPSDSTTSDDCRYRHLVESRVNGPNREAVARSYNNSQDGGILSEADINNTWNSVPVNDPDVRRYFQPRIDAMFHDECLKGIEKFQIFKISSTSSATWTTKREIFIRRI